MIEVKTRFGNFLGRKNRAKLYQFSRRAMHWSQSHLPWGMRSVLGVVCMVLGLFGFLPVIGFWMLPIGIVLVALDVPSWRRRLTRWLDERSEQAKK